MIDIQNEDLVLLKEMPKRLPGRNGKPPAISTLWRWSTTGVKGVKLETILVGGQRYSSLEAFRRFVAAGNLSNVVSTSSIKTGERSNQLLDDKGW